MNKAWTRLLFVLALLVLIIKLGPVPSAQAQGTNSPHATTGDSNDSGSSTLNAPAEHKSSPFHYGAYLDLGYLGSSTQPANHTWRSKGTTNILDRAKFNNATAWLGKDAQVDSPWGFQFGLQAGVDVDSGIPDESEAIAGADVLGHLYYTHLSYLFNVGGGLELKGGLLPGFTGYPGFHAIDNIGYTRPYAGDFVPYFLWGLQAEYPVGAKLSGSLFVISGWDYLKDTNSIPSYGAQLEWQFSEQWKLVQNLYYGSDQEATALEYWRFATDTNLEWSSDRFLMAASYTYGNEKPADQLCQKYYEWVGASVWMQWRATQHWRFALRPEYYYDPDGLQTGAQQTIRAVTTTAEYRFLFRDRHDLSARVEYRFDRSTGDEGGFFEGSENFLVPEQQLLILALMWNFDS